MLTYHAPSHLLPIYLAWELNSNNTGYHLNFSYCVNDKKMAYRVVEKLQYLIKLKAYLRQTFDMENDNLVVTIHEELPAAINFYQSSKKNFDELENQLNKQAHQLKHRSSVILNIVDVSSDAGNVFLLFNIHHIIINSPSLDRFIDDLNQLLEGNTVALEDAEDYLARLGQEKPLIKFNNDNESVSRYVEKVNVAYAEIAPYPMNHPQKVSHYTKVMPTDLHHKLYLLGKKNNISIFNVLLLSYGIFVTKLFNQKTCVIKYPVNNRTDKKINGCFVNMVPLAINIGEEETYCSLIKKLTDELPTLKLVSKYQLSKTVDVGFSPTFSYLTLDTLPDLVIDTFHYHVKGYAQLAHSILNIKYGERDNDLYFSCDILDETLPTCLSSSLLARFFNFTEKIIDNSTGFFRGIDVLFEEERRKILFDFNATGVDYPQHKTLVDWFDEVVSHYPERTAVKSSNNELTYRELNEKAENIAAYLVQKGIKHDELIGILIDHRVEMIVAIIAVLKSGAAYVPIAHDTPEQRIAAILEDAKIKYLLSIPELIKPIDYPVIFINVSQQFYTDTCRKPLIRPNDLAYVVYTSGSTGKPKGILVEHKSVVNYTHFLIKKNELTSKTVGSKYIGFGFDISVTEIYPVILSGGKLCLIDYNDRFDCEKINNFFEKNSVTYACLPTNMGERFFSLKSKQLTVLGVGGEKLNQFSPQSYRVFNIYGPTETTVQPTYFLVLSQQNNIPIGQPIDNVKCYVVNQDMNLLPVGVTGELCVSGINLARGYLDRDALNQEKFISNPFFLDESEKGDYLRLYKTGDLVRWLPCGNLEYIGRKDFQVKLSGYRIELAEIESVLARYPGIHQNAVLLKSSRNHCYLVAYYSSDKEITSREIINYLSKFFPHYMVPNIMIRIDSFPLMLNGKVDRAALPAPNSFPQDHYAHPQDEKQQLICDIFEGVLGIEKVGIDDDFFAISGNSIQAVSLVSRLQRQFFITVSDVFNYKTPRKIAEKASLSKNFLQKRLLKIKNENLLSRGKASYPNVKMIKKLTHYFAEINQLTSCYTEKKISHVLLTGVTGYLGIHLLYQMLQTTPYKIYVLIRADNKQAAVDRLIKQFNFYFGNFLEKYKARINVFCGDLEKAYLGLLEGEYNRLAREIDSILHAAALVKHYGEYNLFYRANVNATINLLELSRLTRAKDFHYISTCSVLGGSILKYDETILTENDIHLRYNDDSNIYIRTKQAAEKAAVECRQHGVSSNIYRVGNLAFSLANGRVQQNKDENAFFNRISAIVNLGVVSDALGVTDISPVDLTAQAVIRLFNKEEIINQVFHVFNPCAYDIAKLLSTYDHATVNQLPLGDFVDVLIEKLSIPNMLYWIERFLLHQGWLEDKRVVDYSAKILQNKTSHILGDLGFSWPTISADQFSRYLDNIKGS